MNSFVPSEVVARFRATSRKLLRPKLPFSARIVSNRSRGSAGLSPRTPCGHSSRSSEAPAARDGDPRNRPNRYRSSRVDCEHVGLLWPRTAALNSAGPSCANGCSASVAARFSRVVSVLDAAHPRWTPRPAPLPRRPRQWDGHARAAAPCSEETSVHAAAFRGGHPGPLTGARHLDIESRGGLTSGQLVVAVDSANSPPDPRIAIGLVDFTGTTSWTAMPRFLADDRLTDPGVYYLKIAFFADSATNPVSVGFDNVRLAWTTDAAVVVYLPSPAPFVLFFTQDKTLFISYFAFLAAVIFLAAGYHLIRERREAWNAFRAPLEAIGTRLKSRSAWIALGQVWMAVTFFQVVFYYLVIAAGINPSSPVNPTPQSAWFWLYELLNAGVYEEFAFRILLIGLPMAIGSVVLRIIEVNRGGTGSGPGAAGRHIGGAWRYLIGGAVRRDSPKETLVAAWAFLIASSVIFGLAHAPGWGWWKVIPAMVAGLGFGYLFVRHGIAAAILAHFVNDYAAALSYEGFGGEAFLLFLNLVFLGLAIAGAGFFAWYAIVAWRNFRGLIDRFRPPTRGVAIPGPQAPYFSTMPPPVATPPDPGQSPPSAQMWPVTPSVGPPAVAVRNPSRIPREYTPSYVPPPYGYQPVRVQCPYCAWVEAKYDAGRFTCTRCGRTA